MQNIFLFIIVIILIFLSFKLGGLGGTAYLRHKYDIITNKPIKALPLDMGHYKNQNDLFNALSINIKDIIFVGDSITSSCEWSELLNDNRILNRGISGDTTFGVVNRIGDIANKHPSKIFIMVGINDLSLKKPINAILENYKTIINIIQSQSPETIIYFQSVLPPNYNIRKGVVPIQSITILNSKLKLLCQQSNIIYIDVFLSLVSNQQLDNKYTFEGLHLNANGYLKWADIVKEYVK